MSSIAPPLSATGAYGSSGVNKKTLTESSATTFVKITIPSSTAAPTQCYQAGTVFYTIFAADGTDFQARSGQLCFVAVNKAGTITSLGFRPDGQTTIDNTTDGVAASSGTLTNVFTITSTGGIISILANAVSSLTQTSLFIVYSVVLATAGAKVTPQ
jgi:hypothetical protein